MTIFNNNPSDISTRSERQKRVYRLLNTLGIEFCGVDHERAETMEACAEIDRALEISMCKNLFLCNRQKTEFYLLLMPGDKPFKTKDLSGQLGISRLSFADSDAMLEHLDLLPGSVSVMGLINDSKNTVQLLIDSELLNDEYIGFHPCECTTSLKIKLCDLTNVILPHIHHQYITVDLPRITD